MVVTAIIMVERIFYPIRILLGLATGTPLIATNIPITQIPLPLVLLAKVVTIVGVFGNPVSQGGRSVAMNPISLIFCPANQGGLWVAMKPILWKARMYFLFDRNPN
jgi:hypothetical protein